MGETSYNGWPVIRDANALRTAVSHGRSFRVAAGHEAYWTAFLDEFYDTVERFDGGQLDDWSHVVRLVRDSSSSVSCHSSGTAIDINALEHPRGRENTFTGRELTALRALLKRFPAIKWGGDFTTVKDDMHFELKHISTSKPLVASFVYIPREQDDMFNDQDRNALGAILDELRGYGRRIENVERLADETRNRVIGVIPETLDQLRDSILNDESVTVTNPYTDEENVINVRTALGRAASVVSNAETRDKREAVTPATAPIKRA